ncbi:hypothetical protein ACIQV3_15370 [Streptomyces sp. NPDC099050]|uniref:hypothetical protein n=1 Tax=Streptomyces sp. NPDC099050 TaxID=3366100 RepID=UPI0037FA5108
MALCTVAAVGGWRAGQLEPADGLRALAVDGKSLRGSRTRSRTAIHLLAAVLHGEKTVIAQGQVDSKSNEITAFQPLLAPLELTGTVATFDALLPQTGHGRDEIRRLKAATVAQLSFPHAVQALQIVRRHRAS